MNKQKDKVEDEYYSDGSRIEKIISVTGDVTTENYFNPSGKLETTFKYTYNAEGICLEELEYDSKGQLISKKNYSYDDSTVNKIETVEYEDGKPKKKSTEINNPID